jgi:homopolymeric O-antigen transport system ATP-binding protein
MSDIAIRLQGLSKRYRISQGGRPSYDTLRDSLVRSLSIFSRSSRNGGRAGQADRPDHIWALKDVSLDIPHGEVIGIIGRNGAGKSTLLKIISRITDPTEGRVELYGRVGSLLEVGTGFHPELTGRENLYLNGAILGMRKAEINAKLDEIVAFAELEMFLDTPVKFYSSGMYVRLAFAVAAHLEPEILLIDEVLAVGDADFQRKCLGKLGDVAHQGRTVIFVSHNMGAMQSLCSTVLLLESGRLIESGQPTAVISNYLRGTSLGETVPQSQILVEDDRFRVHEIVLEQSGFQNPALFRMDEEIQVHVCYEVKKPVSKVLLGFDVFSADGTHLFRTYDAGSHGMGNREPGEYTSTLIFPADVFQFGDYYIDFILGMHRTAGWVSRNSIRLKLPFEGARITDVDYPGLIQSRGEWKVKRQTPVDVRS